MTPDELKPDTGGLRYLKPETGEPTGREVGQCTWRRGRPHAVGCTLPQGHEGAHRWEDDVRPALTAAEWTKGETWLHDRLHQRDTSIRPTPDGGLELRVHEHPAATVSLTMPPQLRAGVAALALHGQPFGFTREDVVALRAAATAARQDDHHFAQELEGGDWAPGRSETIAQRYEALAARIAALLPAEDA